MTTEEAKEIIWDFRETVLKDLAGAYYDNLNLALDTLIDSSSERTRLHREAVRKGECLVCND